MNASKYGNQELEQIVERIVSTVNPIRIYLFGSFAKGNNHAESDFDLFVVVEDNSGNRLKKIQDIRSAIFDIQKTPVDILLNYETEFERRKMIPSIEKEVEKDGVVLYG